MTPLALTPPAIEPASLAEAKDFLRIVADDEDELLTWINDTDYGLSGYVFSRDLGWALRLAERMEVGMVGVNRGLVSDPAAPFGGVKQSGLGREGGAEGIEEYTSVQYIGIADPWAATKA